MRIFRRRIPRNLIRRLSHSASYGLSWITPDAWESARVFCAFVGQPRTGHSFVGSLLDAHPQACIAAEADAFEMVANGFHRHALFTALTSHSRFVATVLRNRTAGYDYRVGEGHGRSDDLRVIGDKMGGRTLERLGGDPTLIQRLEAEMGIPMNLVHVVRNLFDSITTGYLRSGPGRAAPPVEGLILPERATLERRIRRFTERARRLQDLLAWDVPVLTLYHEEFIHRPREELVRLLDFLGLSAPAGYLDRCVALTLPAPRRTRFRIRWPQDLRDRVEATMKELPYLHPYTFDS